MTHADIVKTISKVTAFDRRGASSLLKLITDLILEGLVSHKEVTVQRLGTFRLIPYKGSSLKFNNGGKDVKSRNHYRIKFRAAKNVKELLRKLEVINYEERERTE